MLAARFPQVTVVRNTENLGFGRAVNRGAAEAGDADVIVLVNNDAVCAPDFVARAARALRGRIGRHGGGCPPAGSGTGSDRLGRDRARHDPRLVGLPLEPAGERARSRARPGRPLRRRSRVSPVRIPWSSAASTRRSSRTGRTSISPCASATPAGGACSRPVRAPCTSTGRRSARHHLRRAGWRRSAVATCWRSTVWAAATRCDGRRSRHSTGPCSPSTSSSRREAGPARERLRARSLGLRTARPPRTTRAGHGRLRDRTAAAGEPTPPAPRRRPSGSLQRMVPTKEIDV